MSNVAYVLSFNEIELKCGVRSFRRGVASKVKVTFTRHDTITQRHESRRRV